MNEDITRELVKQIGQKATDHGMLIEAGWIALKTLTIPSHAPQVQLDEMRNSF